MNIGEMQHGQLRRFWLLESERRFPAVFSLGRRELTEGGCGGRGVGLGLSGRVIFH